MPKPDFQSNIKYFFHIIWAPYYWFSPKILILKHIFFFLKSIKRGNLTKIFATTANFNRPLYQIQDFIRTLNILPYYLRYLLLIQHKKLILKHVFYFQKSVKRGSLTKTFPTPANFNGPLCQSKIFIQTLNIFSILFELPTIDSAQKF